METSAESVHGQGALIKFEKKLRNEIKEKDGLKEKQEEKKENKKRKREEVPLEIKNLDSKEMPHSKFDGALTKGMVAKILKVFSS